jgi:hypothetical protein
MFLRLAAAMGLIIAGMTAQAAPKSKPATALVFTNTRQEPATAVTVSAGDKTVSLAKPLAPKGTATLRLPKMSDCMVSVAATFADESVVELDDFDTCKDNTVRFTD